MTSFLFWLQNHNEIGQRSLEDVIGIFGHQLRALGHGAVWDINERDKVLSGASGINIIVEGFTKRTVEVLAGMREQGARFVILATEEPTPKGFNWGTQKEMVWRQEVFPEAAKHCEGILHLVPGKHVTEWYGQHAPAAYVELGYAPTLVRRNDTEPTFEFGFYGSLSKRRWRIIKELARQTAAEKAVKIMADFQTQEERDIAMRQAKVIIQIRKFDEMGLVSSSRCNTALCLGRPVVAEPHDLSKPWDEIVRFSSSMDDFYAQCLMVRSGWRRVHEDQMARFKAKLPPSTVAEALTKIGIGVPERIVVQADPVAIAAGPKRRADFSRMLLGGAVHPLRSLR